MAYSLDDIFIDSIFEAKDIYDVNFKVKPNTRPILMVECSVKENQNIESIVRNLHDKNLTIFIYIGEQKKDLFTGIVKDCKLVCNNKIDTLKMKVMGFSVMLDKEKHTRIFQDKEFTYKEVLNHTMSKKIGKVIFNKEDTKIERLLFQYNETDWQFMKRVSGLGESILIPLFYENGVRLSYGLPRSAKEIELKEDFYASGNHIQDKAKDYNIEGIYHMFYSDEDYELGTVVKNRGLRFVICEKEVQTVEATLKFYYKVCKEENIKSNVIYNEGIRGLVMSAEVADVEAEDIFVKFSIDSGLEKKRYRLEWLPITGNVMYCMPEVGTNVKVYFGDRDESKNVFAIECENMSKFPNEIKGIITKDGKTLHIKDNGVELKADNNVNISGKNLTFSSPDSLMMSARKKVKIKSDMMEINADKDISIQKK
jgi:hypothetical protein